MIEACLAGIHPAMEENGPVCAPGEHEQERE